MIVLDANIFISALIKDSSTRRIIVSSDESFLFPEAIFEDIKEHRPEFLKKTGLSDSEFETLIQTLLKYVIVVPDEKTLPQKELAFELMGEIDPDDVPILATALAYEGSFIWTSDKHFQKQNKVKILSTADLLGGQRKK
jgi:predicted nucleic acid-binding protein